MKYEFTIVEILKVAEVVAPWDNDRLNWQIFESDNNVRFVATENFYHGSLLVFDVFRDEHSDFSIHLVLYCVEKGIMPYKFSPRHRTFMQGSFEHDFYISRAPWDAITSDNLNECMMMSILSYLKQF